MNGTKVRQNVTTKSSEDIPLNALITLQSLADLESEVLISGEHWMALSKEKCLPALSFPPP